MNSLPKPFTSNVFAREGYRVPKLIAYNHPGHLGDEPHEASGLEEKVVGLEEDRTFDGHDFLKPHDHRSAWMGHWQTYGYPGIPIYTT